MRLNNLLRNSFPQPRQAGDVANTSLEISGQSEAALQRNNLTDGASLVEDANRADGEVPKTEGLAHEGNQLEIERIASAVDLAISLEDS
jgi:hypothetical protein